MSDVFEETPTHTPNTHVRFELRTIFVVTAVTGCAIALFLHYGQLVGLILAAVVVWGGMYYLAADRPAVIVCIVIFVPLWLGLHWFGPETSMRHYRRLRSRIVRTVGTDRLQQWAVDVLDSLPPVDRRSVISLNRDAMPEDIRATAGNLSNVAVLSDIKKFNYLVFGYEHGEYRWSIVIKRSGLSWPDPNCFDEIADGIEGVNWSRHQPGVVIDPPFD